MSSKASLHATVQGLVQGVFFRAFVLRCAQELGVYGYVRNLLGERAVEVVAEGEREKLEELVHHLELGPRGARVERVDVEWSEYRGDYSRFEIRF